MSRAAPSSMIDLSSYALALHLAQAADIAAEEGCRAAAETLVWAVYAAFTIEPPPREQSAEDGIAA